MGAGSGGASEVLPEGASASSLRLVGAVAAVAEGVSSGSGDGRSGSLPVAVTWSAGPGLDGWAVLALRLLTAAATPTSALVGWAELGCERDSGAIPGKGSINSKGSPRQRRLASSSLVVIGVAAAMAPGLRLSSHRVCSSCCHCHSITASSRAASSSPTSRGLAARGESWPALAACSSLHHSSTSSSPEPPTRPALVAVASCRALSRCCNGRRALRGICSSSRDQTSAGRRQSTKAGSRPPRPQQSRRSRAGSGPGSLPASSKSSSKASSGHTPTAIS